MKKRILILIAIIMVIGLASFTVAVSAAEITPSQPAIGDGSESNPYQITTAAELYWFAEYVNAGNASACAKLMNDITVNENVIINGALNSDTSGFVAWTPIGKYTASDDYKVFSGTFDGNGKKIKGLYFNDSTADYVGFIGYASDEATIKNIGIVDSHINGGKYVGALAGGFFNGTAIGCYNSGVVNGAKYVGGLVGCTRGAEIKDCYNTGTVSGTDEHVGGLIGFSSIDTVQNCYNTGSVNNTGERTGGIVGFSNTYTYVKNCYNTGDISGTERVGGIVGCSSDEVSFSYNTGNISGTNYIGGVVGYNTGPVMYCYNTAAVNGSAQVGGVVGYNVDPIVSCFNTGDVRGGEYTGAIVGINHGDDLVKNCCYLIGSAVDTNGKSQAGEGYHSLGYSATDVTGRTTGLADFSTGEAAHILQSGVEVVEGVVPQVWGQDIDNGKTVQAFPSYSGAVVYRYEKCGVIFFSNTNHDSVYHSYTNGFCAHNCGIYEPATGSGTSSDPYKIANAGQLYWFAAVVNGDTNATAGVAQNKKAYAELTANIVINENLLSKITIDESGVATVKEGYTLRVWTPIGKDTDNRYNATFNGAGKTISGLYFNDSTVSYVALFGCLDHSGTDSKIQNVGLKDSYICGDQYVGGIVSYCGAVVDNCFNDSTIKGTKYVGGVSGYNYKIIQNSFNSGTVYGGQCVGGITGYCSTSSSITQSYNTGNISGNTYVGGITGDVSGRDGTTINGCYNTGTIRGSAQVGGIGGYCYAIVDNCYNKGNVIGGNMTGGIAGENSHKMMNCYNQGIVSGSERVGGIVGNNTSSVTLCYNEQNINGTNYVGGVVGYNTSNVTNCYNTKSVSGTANIGGVVGYNVGTVTSCFNTGIVKGTSNYIGGVVGINHRTMTNCYYLEGCAKDGSDVVQFGAGNRYSGGTTTDSNGSSAGYSDFTTGEVAYLLNGDQSNITWGQKLGVGGDPTPVLDSTKRVYRLEPCIAYSNTTGENPHTGEITYSASNNVITATCSKCNTADSITITAEGKPYDGTPVTATLTGFIDGVTISVDDITYTGNTNAGTYVASITIEGVTASVAFTIEKATVTVTANAVTKAYGEADPELTYDVSGLIGEDQLTGALTRAEGETVGEYAIKQGTLSANDNYTISFTSAKLTIAKATAPAIVWPTASGLTYGQKLSASTLTSADSNGTFAWENGDTVPTVTNSGYVVVYTPNDTDNYDYSGVELTKTISVTVSKAAATVATAPTANELTYAGEAQVLVNAGTTDDGKLVYSLSENGEFTEAIPIGTNAGEYTVWYYVVGDENHTDSTKDSVKVTIAKAKATIAVDTTTITVTYGETVNLPTANTNFGTVVCDKTAADLVNAGTYTVTYSVAGTDNYDGDTKTVTVIVNQKAVAEPTVTGTYTYTGSEKTVALTGVESYMTIASGNKAINAGSYEVEITLNSNYKWANGSDGKLQWSIAKAKAEISVNTDPITVTYGEAVILPTATTNFGTVSCDKTAAELVNAGTYTVTYSVEGTANYEGNTKSITVTINKADGSMTAPVAKTDLEYNGLEQALVTAGTANGGTLQYSLDNATWSATIPVAKNAGKYTVYYKMVGDANHNDDAGGSVTVSIAKKALTITAEDKAICVDATYTLTYKVDGLVTGDTLPVDVALNTEATVATAGEYAITASGPAESTNYSITYANGTLTVNAHVDTNKDHSCESGCGIAVGTHEDTDNDHDCEHGCSVAIGTCGDADKDHTCDYGCGKSYGTCEDASKDHTCDYGCGKSYGTCEDPDKDHTCDYGCGKSYGTCEDADKDHTCDYGCGKSYGTCEDADKDHTCDYGCGKSYGTCEDADKDHTCDYGCGKAYGTCEDANKDHTCDYGCGKSYGTHGDTDKNHVCDYGCAVTIGTCADANKDHTCDYGCGKAYGTCADANKDHTCDYGCGKTYGTCEDADKNHTCDYCCGKAYGTCEDADKNHTCDYGCGKTYGTCLDADRNHTCDYGCSIRIGTHTDTNRDHVCDYGCAVTIGTCADADKDHACDYSCGKSYGTCEDTNKDHACDYGCGCGEAYGICEDADKDHTCDYGCGKSYGTCEDTNKDHACDYGCGKAYGTHEAANGKHTCEYCGETVSSCADADSNHMCDICAAELTHKYSGEWSSDAENHWNECACGAKNNVALHVPGAEATATKDQTCTICAYILQEKTGEQVQAPVTGGQEDIEIDVTIDHDNDKAYIGEMDAEEIEKVINDNDGDATIEIDLSKLDQEIGAVVLPVTTIQQILEVADKVNTDNESVEIKLPVGTVTLDEKTMEAIVEQAECNSISLVLEAVGTDRLNDLQKATVEDMNVCGGYEAYLFCHVGNKRISDFEGGVATLSVPFALPEGVSADQIVVWHIADDGSKEKLHTWYEEGTLHWDVSHFSDFIIAVEETSDPGTGPVEPDGGFPWWILLIVVVALGGGMTAWWFLQRKKNK